MLACEIVLTCMAEEVTESVTIAGKLLKIISIDNLLERVVSKPVSNVIKLCNQRFSNKSQGYLKS